MPKFKRQRNQLRRGTVVRLKRKIGNQMIRRGRRRVRRTVRRNGQMLIATRSERKITIAAIYRSAAGVKAKWVLPVLAKLPKVDALVMAPVWWQKTEGDPEVVTELQQTGALIVFDISTDAIVLGSSWAAGTITAISQIEVHWLRVTVAYNVVAQERCGTIALAVVPLGLNESSVPGNFSGRPYEWVRKLRPSAQMQPSDQEVTVQLNFSNNDAASFRQRVGFIDKGPKVLPTDNVIARVAIATDATNVGSSAFNDSHSTFVVLVEAQFKPMEFGFRSIKPEYKLRTSDAKPTVDTSREYHGRWTTAVPTISGIEDFRFLTI